MEKHDNLDLKQALLSLILFKISYGVVNEASEGLKLNDLLNNITIEEPVFSPKNSQNLRFSSEFTAQKTKLKDKISSLRQSLDTPMNEHEL